MKNYGAVKGYLIVEKVEPKERSLITITTDVTAKIIAVHKDDEKDGFILGAEIIFSEKYARKLEGALYSVPVNILTYVIA